MNWKSKSLVKTTGVTLAGLATVAILSVAQVSSDNRNTFCGHVENVTIDKKLPLSHPSNRCAASQSQGVSWSNWFIGRSSSYQFHFIDLLELLSRSGDNNAKNPTKSN